MSEYLRREETRRDIEAALAARRELGPEYHDSIAAGLAERVEQLAAIRMAELRHEAEIQEREAKRGAVDPRSAAGPGHRLAGDGGTDHRHQRQLWSSRALLGVLVSWAGIVGVNVAAGLRRKDR